MALVFILCTQQANTRLIGSTEDLQNLLVFSTKLLLQISNCIDQLVPLESSPLIVWLDMCFTVRGQARQTGFHSFELSPSAEITRHISRSSITLSRRRIEPSPLEFSCNFSQHGVSAQIRPCGKGLSALGAAVDTCMISLIPAVLNTPHTVTVSTCCSDWVLQ